MTNETAPLIANIEEIITRFAPKKQGKRTIDRSTRLADELGIDSPRMIDIVLELEDRFHISLEDIDVENTATVGDLVDLVEKRTGGK